MQIAFLVEGSQRKSKGQLVRYYARVTFSTGSWFTPEDNLRWLDAKGPLDPRLGSKLNEVSAQVWVNVAASSEAMPYPPYLWFATCDLAEEWLTSHSYRVLHECAVSIPEA